MVRIHLWWSTTHVICPIKKIEERAPFWEKFAQKFPNVKFYLSHSCEHNCRNKGEVLRRMILLKKLAPSCTPVNCVWQGQTVEGWVNEKHGKDCKVKGRYIASVDGSTERDFSFAAWHKKHADAEIRFMWGALFNLNDGHQPANPAERTAAPSRKYVLEYAKMAVDPGKPYQPPTFASKPIKEPNLYKPMSQDTNDTREDKPLLISDLTNPYLDIKTSAGQVVGKLKYYGTFTGGLHRHYSGGGGSGLWGYEIADKAKQLSGQEWVWIHGGSKIYGPIHPVFRWGYYR